MVQMSLRSRIMRQKALALIDELWLLYPDLDLAFSYLPEREVLSCRNLTHQDCRVSNDCDGEEREVKASEVTVKVGEIRNSELLKQFEQSLGLRKNFGNPRWQMSN